ncbi:MAG: hypothetical protein JW880_02100 [Candidatus Thermoplasmatota archaeon]|nr:hypothetical protein [Candidatus Thermoplasmatota archaeon]
MSDEGRSSRPTPTEDLGFSNITKDLLELKDTSELMVDLAYSALLYDNEDIANEIICLEDIADAIEREVVLKALKDVEQKGDPHRNFVMVRLAQAMEMIADAGASMADVVLRDIEKNPVLRLSLRDSKIIITAVRVSKTSSLNGKSLGEVRLASESGMWIVAMRRDKSYIYGPDENTVMKVGDQLIARGPKEGVPILREMAGCAKRLGIEECE